MHKQWAGFVYDALTKESTVSIKKIESLGKRLERIEHQLKLIAESTKVTGDNNKVTIDIERLSSEMDIENLEEMQNKIDVLLVDILKDIRNMSRIQFKKGVTEKECSAFLETLNEIVKSYKWSKVVSVTELMKNFEYVYWEDRTDIPYKTLLELSIISNNLSESDRKLLLKTILSKFNEQFVPDREVSDDVPF